MTKRTIIILILLLASMVSTGRSAATPRPQAPTTSDHTASEKAIRMAHYEVALALLTGDVKGFWKHAARRTPGLYDLVFAELSANSKFREQFRQAGVTNGEGLLDAGMRAIISQSAAIPRSKLEELAREQSASPLTFVSDTEATGQNKSGGQFRAVLEDNVWKIDIIENLKKVYLQRFPLSAESKARIEKY